MFNMRGFSAANSLFVDGVRDDGLISRDVFNLEQIEVFSGPTGSDVGRTNAAGYINLATKTPNLEGTQAGTLSYGAGEQVRATLDVNQPVRFGDRGTFLGNAAVRVNALWQDGGTAGRDYVGRESKSIAPSIAFGLNTPTRASLSGQIMRQDNARRLRPARGRVPDWSARHRRQSSRPRRSSSRTTTAAPTTTTTTSARTTSRSGSSTTSRRDVTLRNQTRYNTTTREAVITSIAEPGGLQPGDESRHAQPSGERAAQRHLLESDEPERARLDRQAASRAQRRIGNLERKPVRADAGRCRHARAHRPQPARRLQPGRRHEHRPDRRALRGQHRHRRGLCLRRLRPRSARARQWRDPGGKLRHEVTRGDGRRRRHRHRGRRHARQRKSRPRLPAERAGQPVRVLRLVAHAAWIGELRAQRRRHQPEQPQRRSAGINELRARHQVGSGQ